MVVANFDDPDPLRIALIQHRRQVSRVDHCVVVGRESLKQLQQVTMPGVMEMNARFFEEQDAGVFVIALRRVGELPRKRDVPAETRRAPTQAHGHSETDIFDENVKSRGVDLDVEGEPPSASRVSRTAASDTTDEAARCRMRRMSCPRAIVLWQEIIDVDVSELEDDEDGLIFIREAVPTALCKPLRELIELCGSTGHVVFADVNAFRYERKSPGSDLCLVELPNIVRQPELSISVVSPEIVRRISAGGADSSSGIVFRS